MRAYIIEMIDKSHRFVDNLLIFLLLVIQKDILPIKSRSCNLGLFILFPVVFE